MHYQKMSVASCCKQHGAMLWGGVVGNHNADCVPRLHSQQKAPAGGMGHGATWFSQLPNLIYGYNGLPIFFFLNWTQHACPQNVQATVQEIRVLCLNPTLHCT